MADPKEYKPKEERTIDDASQPSCGMGRILTLRGLTVVVAGYGRG